MIEVAVLDAGLDDVEGRGDDQRGRGAADGGDEVLRPRRRVVVVEPEDLLLGEGGAAEEGEGARRVAGGGPAGAAVEAQALVGDDAEEPPRPERGRVGLSLDLEDVEGQQDDLADADERARGGIHDGFAGASAEGGVEVIPVVLGQVVSYEGLAAVFVYSLQDLGGKRVSLRPSLSLLYATSSLCIRQHSLSRGIMR